MSDFGWSEKLDPSDPRTKANRDEVLGLLASINVEDIVAPSKVAWIEAAMISGILARTQHLARPKKQRERDRLRLTRLRVSLKRESPSETKARARFWLARQRQPKHIAL